MFQLPLSCDFSACRGGSKNQFYDVKLVSRDGTTLEAHAIVLATWSDSLEAAIKPQSGFLQDGKLHLDFPTEIIELILDHMYSAPWNQNNSLSNFCKDFPTLTASLYFAKVWDVKSLDEVLFSQFRGEIMNIQNPEEFSIWCASLDRFRNSSDEFQPWHEDLRHHFRCDMYQAKTGEIYHNLLLASEEDLQIISPDHMVEIHEVISHYQWTDQLLFNMTYWFTFHKQQPRLHEYTCTTITEFILNFVLPHTTIFIHQTKIELPFYFVKEVFWKYHETHEIKLDIELLEPLESKEWLANFFIFRDRNISGDPPASLETLNIEALYVLIRLLKVFKKWDKLEKEVTNGLRHLENLDIEAVNSPKCQIVHLLNILAEKGLQIETQYLFDRLRKLYREITDPPEELQLRLFQTLITHRQVEFAEILKNKIAVIFLLSKKRISLLTIEGLTFIAPALELWDPAKQEINTSIFRKMEDIYLSSAMNPDKQEIKTSISRKMEDIYLSHEMSKKYMTYHTFLEILNATDFGPNVDLQRKSKILRDYFFKPVNPFGDMKHVSIIPDGILGEAPRNQALGESVQCTYEKCMQRTII